MTNGLEHLAYEERLRAGTIQRREEQAQACIEIQDILFKHRKKTFLQ